MKAGLYNPEEFRDNCGFGLIAQMEGEKSHHLLQTAIEALTCMTHRGGIAADGKTGDGCGLLIQIPDKFFRTVVKEQLDEELPQQFAVGMIFLSNDPVKAQFGRETLEKELQKQRLSVIGWRKVPFDSECLGPIAKDQLPQIEQIFVGPDGEVEEKEFTARLYMSRRYTNMMYGQ